jgi:hypothetical protein
MTKDFKPLIEQECDELKKLLIAKNADYGSSFAKSPVLYPTMPPKTAILVRMSDKINRIGNLVMLAKTEKTEVNEPLTETVKDLAGYCLLFNVLSREDSVKYPHANVDGKS